MFRITGKVLMWPSKLLIFVIILRSFILRIGGIPLVIRFISLFLIFRFLAVQFEADLKKFITHVAIPVSGIHADLKGMGPSTGVPASYADFNFKKSQCPLSHDS